MTMKTKSILYWTMTGLVAFFIGGGGASQIWQYQTNPHGVVTLAVAEGGRQVIWRAETNSPSILRRRGWSADSLQVGEKITIEGWPARDGSRYLRLRSATRANGEPVGKAPTPLQEK